MTNIQDVLKHSIEGNPENLTQAIDSVMVDKLGQSIQARRDKLALELLGDDDLE